MLADIVIGNEIKGTERKEGTAQRYVRVPDQKRTYGVNIKAEPSTRFADWIETNLLKVEAGRIRRLVFDNYKVGEDPNRPGVGAWSFSLARNPRSNARTRRGRGR